SRKQPKGPTNCSRKSQRAPRTSQHQGKKKAEGLATLRLKPTPVGVKPAALELQRARAQHLQWLRTGFRRIAIEQVVSPAVVVLNGIAAAPAPIETGGSEGGPGIVCYVHCAGDLPVAAAVVLHRRGAENQHNSIPSEVALERQVAGDDQ